MIEALQNVNLLAPLVTPQVTGSPQGTLNAQQVRAQAREHAEEFESVFLATFMQQMFAGRDTEGPFSGGHSEGIYQSMLAERYADTIARSGGIGLADTIYQEILKAQQVDPRSSHRT